MKKSLLNQHHQHVYVHRHDNLRSILFIVSMGDKTHLCKYYCIPTKELWAFPNNRIPFLMITFKEKKPRICRSWIHLFWFQIKVYKEKMNDCQKGYTYRGEYLKELILFIDIIAYQFRCSFKISVQIFVENTQNCLDKNYA